jgi:hypothetical protein
MEPAGVWRKFPVHFNKPFPLPYTGLPFPYRFPYREDQCGCAELPQFLDIEEFWFTGQGWNRNCVRIGRTPNGSWSYGIKFKLGASGGGSRIDIFGKKFNDRRECLMEGVKEMKNLLREAIMKAPGDKCGNYDVKLNRKVISECDAMLFELKLGKQLALFND